MEAMGNSSIPIVAAFFIGLMTAISPCPLASNITAIAYASKRLHNSRHTLLVGFFYTLGRMITYVLLASLIVWFGLSTQAIALFLQRYGEKLLGPLLILVGLLMLIPLDFGQSQKLERFKEKIAGKGLFGSLMLGVVFALAFCPFSAVLFFGMLIPIALKAGDGIIIPSVFAIATGLPVILFSFVLVHSVSKLSRILNKVQSFEKWARRIAAVLIILSGLYFMVGGMMT